MDLVFRIEKTPVGSSDKPNSDCKIVDCGQLSNHQVRYTDFPEDSEISTDENERVRIANEIKSEGNEYFKKQEYNKAIGSYSKSTRYIPNEKKDEKEFQELDLSIQLNMAACFLKTNHFDDAADICTKIIEKNPKNSKAIFRLGQANFGNGNLEKAKSFFDQAASLEPNDKGIQLELKKNKTKGRGK